MTRLNFVYVTIFATFAFSSFAFAGSQFNDSSVEDLLGFDFKPNFETNTAEYSLTGMNVYQTIETFAGCAAILNTYARVLSESEAEYTSHGFHQRANGVELAARYIADQAGFKNEIYDSFYGTKVSTIQLYLKNDSSEWDSFSQKELESCESAGNLQTFIVNLMRKNAYQK